MQLLLKFLARALVAIVWLVVFMGVGYEGGWVFCAGVALVSLVALHEYYSSLRLKGIRPTGRLGWFCALLLLVITQLSTTVPPTQMPPGDGHLGWAVFNGEGALHLTLLVLLFCVAGSMVSQFRKPEALSAVTNSATTVFGVVYIGLLFSFLLRMRYVDVAGLMQQQHGIVPALVVYPWGAELWHRMGSLIFVIGPVWLGDTMAFVVGGIWGRHPLAPRISPGKTIEGAIAALIAAVAGAVLVGWWLGMGLVVSAGLGLMMGSVGQMGDLSKSVLKRDLGIKDFGTIFGPHGGVLDRFDAILFSLPLVYWYFWFLVMKVGHG